MPTAFVPADVRRSRAGSRLVALLDAVPVVRTGAGFVAAPVFDDDTATQRGYFKPAASSPVTPADRCRSMVGSLRRLCRGTLLAFAEPARKVHCGRRTGEVPH
ncbi:hypothetical protein GCM10022222_02720 [Amycolatopsis ultiminotia]|uniref:Uncharacterized protein n=1 Tax=Amycolatopsis ultiminotia TaxID=543629 RepID=A0ABP6UX74_9PSEU